jgi:hypothetical protein
MKVNVLRTFVTPLLIHIHQKEKIALVLDLKVSIQDDDDLLEEFDV